MTTITEDEYGTLQHYGILRKSGRYPWGTGDTPYERAGTFMSDVKNLRAEGLSDKEIAQGFGMTTSDFRTTTSIARQAHTAGNIAWAKRLKDKGMSNVKIAETMGIPDTSVGNLLKERTQTKNQILGATAEMLRKQVEVKKYIDVGKGVELHMGISHEKLRDARKILEDEGYTLHYVSVPQLGTGKNTTVKVLAAPGTTWSEVNKNKELIQPAQLKSTDGGRSFDHTEPPISISSKRVKVRYAEEGGAKEDGVIHVRPGVKDVSLGDSRYAQVRVAVDGTHYLKGMAMYSDDVPAGVDLVFNTNKSSTGNKLDAMKPMQKDDLTGEISKDDPFGAMISNQVYKKHSDGSFVRDSFGRRVVESTMNLVNEEGKWEDWSKNLSSQMLSKQKASLVESQLKLTYESKTREFKEIMSLTNPTVRKHLLAKFADSADSSAVHLKAAHMPRQANKVILPINSLKDYEVYAPTFNQGERVVLVRFPHGGIFEIPELTVNNGNAEGKKRIGPNAIDAIGITSKVAERLSGADFDGDTVLVIPNNHGKIKTEPALKELQGFDPKSMYPEYEGMPKMAAKGPQSKGFQMGDVSNLITDMTIKGAPFDEIARAVKHSMVVIDAEKHNLNWKQSAIDNGIAALKKKYQGGDGKKGTLGASTIVSKATSETRVPDRKPRPAKDGGPIDPKTGKLVYVETGAEYSPGNPKTIRSTKLAETDDAHTLSSGTAKEKLYADHSNRLKALANEARREYYGLKGIEYSPSANKAYADEVRSLDAKLNLALKNAPLERRAQLIGNAIYEQKKNANPDRDSAELKKLKAKELLDARARVGAKKHLIEIEGREWEAIQAGAISNRKLENILDNADVEEIKKLATPKDQKIVSPAMRSRAMVLMRSNNYTLAEAAGHLGISVSTLQKLLSGDES